LSDDKSDIHYDNSSSDTIKENTDNIKNNKNKIDEQHIKNNKNKIDEQHIKNNKNKIDEQHIKNKEHKIDEQHIKNDNIKPYSGQTCKESTLIDKQSVLCTDQLSNTCINTQTSNISVRNITSNRLGNLKLLNRSNLRL
jgi:hypothetical protein